MAAAPALPPARDRGGSYRVAIVCLGNICRSPMADVVLTEKLAAAGLGAVEVVSAGTGGWHVGDPMDRRAAALLTAHGYDASAHEVRKFESAWFDDCDLVLAMDGDNYTDLGALRRHGLETERLMMFRDFDPRSAGEHDRDVPDPFYGGNEGFTDVLAMVERTSTVLVAALGAALARESETERTGG